MRIKQKELIGKLPKIMYIRPLTNQEAEIVQVFDNPKCVNMIKEVKGKVVERQCYPLTDKQYQTYIDNYNKHKSNVEPPFIYDSPDERKGNSIKTLFTKLRRLIWK